MVSCNRQTKDMPPPNPSGKPSTKNSSLFWLALFCVVFLVSFSHCRSSPRVLKSSKVTSHNFIPYSPKIIVDVKQDLCQEEVKPPKYKEMFFLRMGGDTKYLKGPKNSKYCELEIGRLQYNKDVFVELSISKNPAKNNDDCFTISGIGFDEVTPKCEKDCELNCNINDIDKTKKVFFREKGSQKEIKIQMSEIDLTENMELFVEHLAEKEEEETVDIIGDLVVACDHPNPNLTPYLSKDGTDITGELVGEEKRLYIKRHSLEDKIEGEYKCSWNKERTPRTVKRVNVYAPEIVCKLRLEGKTMVVDENKVVKLTRGSEEKGRLDFSCELGKATIDDTSQWALTWGSDNGKDVQYKATLSTKSLQADFQKDVQDDFYGNTTQKRVTYSCSVDRDHTKNPHRNYEFLGGDPRACSITIVVQDEPEDAGVSTTIIAGVVVAVVFVLIILVLVVVYMKRRASYSAKDGSVPKGGQNNPAVEMTD